MSRVPLSDDFDPEDEVIEDEAGTVGKEEQYDDLDFNKDKSDPYALEPDEAPFDEEDIFNDGEWSDEDCYARES